MINIDFHLHTLITDKDRYNRDKYEFSLDFLKHKIELCKLNAIAITNHDIFDKNNFEDIEHFLKDKQVKIFPGMEISFKKFHLLLICSNTNENKELLIKISETIKDNQDGFITIEKFETLIKTISHDNYILIPHYWKKPKIDDDLIKNFNNKNLCIKCGEASSIDKQYREMKNENKTLFPVAFSDDKLFIESAQTKNGFDEMTKYFDEHHHRIFTCCDTENNDFSSIRNALINGNIHIGEDNDIEYSDNNDKIKPGINIILGSRGSGKTKTLNLIKQCFPDDEVKYIKQNEISKLSTDDDWKNYLKNLAENKNKVIYNSDGFQNNKSNLTKLIKLLDLNKTNNFVKKLDNEIDNLVAAAKKYKPDVYSKCKLYIEDISISKYSNLMPLAKEAILDLSKVISNSWIKEHQKISNDINTIFNDLLKEYKLILLNIKIESQIDGLISNIKQCLAEKSKSSKFDCSLNSALINAFKYEKVIHSNNIFFSNSKERSTVWENEKYDFRTALIKNKISNLDGLKEINKNFKKTNFSTYCETSIAKFINSCRENEISESDILKSFFHFDINVKIKKGDDYIDLSAGEKSYYILINELNEAEGKELLLVDEIEPTFDNIFLYGQIVDYLNKKLKRKINRICITTHNSTVGMMLDADWIIFKSIKIVNNKLKYITYSCKPGEKQLKSTQGESIETYTNLMDVMESGVEVYEQKRSKYDRYK